MNRIVPLTIVLALAIGGIAAAAAKTGPKAREDSDKIVLENDEITVWFQGKKPMLHVFATGAGAVNGTPPVGYQYKMRDVVEYRDIDANGLPDPTEVLARLSLEKASAFEVNTTDVEGGVVLNLTLEAPVQIAGGLPVPDQAPGVAVPDRTARVTLSFAIRGEDTVLSVGGANLTVPENAVKYDFVVEKWPWTDASNGRLALDVQVVGVTDAVTFAGLSGLAVEGANGTKLGAVTWTETAQGVTADGAEVEVPVKTKVVADADAANASSATRIVHTYDAGNLQTLVHDPVLGVASAQGSLDGANDTQEVADKVDAIPGPGVALGVLALAAVALLARRARG
ncbi:MAG TPA: hypothetical protein VHH36_03045 [Candidatus Thermoplasmatota archaeon]|nr:hypothetical protein [Candidatus Thermoplasmatota archaeon]